MGRSVGLVALPNNVEDPVNDKISYENFPRMGKPPASLSKLEKNT